MNRIFAYHIGTLTEVYIDDILIKTMEDEKLLPSGCLHKHKMRLNPQKCASAVKVGKYLGFMLTRQGIEVNLDKCQVILEMKRPTSVKEVQRLMGRIASFSRILVASALNTLPFFILLRKENNFEWISVKFVPPM